MKKKLIMLLVLLMCAVLVFSACGSEPGAEGTDATDGTGGDTTDTTTDTPQDVADTSLRSVYANIARDKAHVDTEAFEIGDATGLKIGICMGNVGSSFFRNIADSAAAVIEQYGGEAVIADAGYSFETQVSQIEDFITQGVDGIIIDPCDPVSSVSDVLTKACDAGIPVVDFDSALAEDFDLCLGMVITDNYAIGYGVGEYVASLLIDKYGELTGTVASMDGVEGIIPAVDRYTGFWDAINDTDPDNTVEEVCHLYCGTWNEEGGMEMAGDIFVSHPDVDVCFGISDPFAIAAQSEAERVGITDCIIAASDGQKAALKLVKDGTMVKAIGINSPIVQGEGAASLLLSYLTTGYVPEHMICQPVPTVATPENIEDLYDPDSPF